MPDPPRQLDRLQRWMQSVITHPLGVRAGVASDEARQAIDVCPDAIEQVVLPSQQLDSYSRLAVYGDAYYMRLLECLDHVFPITRQTVGDDVFHQMGLDYLQCYPSHSYTLNQLGARFAEFLAHTPPQREEWSDFLSDLARLEWTLEEVFDGPGVEQQPPLLRDQLAAMAPDRWPRAVLRLVVCLRLLRFDFPVSDFYTQARRGAHPTIPLRSESHLAVTRRNYVVRRFPLSRPQFVLLAALHAGETIGSALEKLATETNASDDDLSRQLAQWFQFWASEGFFAAVESPSLDEPATSPSNG